MAYLVRITARAESDLKSLFETIRAEHSLAAMNWYIGLTDAIRTLKEFPYRCPMTTEKKQLRHLLCGNKPHVYRVVYRVIEQAKRVEILHIRHGARSDFKSPDLQ